MISEAEVREIVAGMNAETFAGLIDHTLLDPAATKERIVAFVNDAVSQGTNICVNESRIPDVCDYLKGRDYSGRVAAVIGFPFGATHTEIKAFSAKCVLESGADEVDMVANIGFLKERDSRFREDIASVAYTVREFATRFPRRRPVLKVIIETCYLDDEDKRFAVETIKDIAAEFSLPMMVKTSTGYGNPPEGRAKGATVEDIRLIARALGEGYGSVGIKASGGIRALKTALAMMNAAGLFTPEYKLRFDPERLPYIFRIGTSSGSKIMGEFMSVKNSF